MFPYEDEWEGVKWDEYGAEIDPAAFQPHAEAGAPPAMGAVSLLSGPVSHAAALWPKPPPESERVEGGMRHSPQHDL